MSYHPEKTKIVVTIAARGGFESKRGTYTTNEKATKEIDGDLVTVLRTPGLLSDLIEEAKSQLQYDEEIIGRSLEAWEMWVREEE